MRAIVIIPTYNEKKNISDLVEGIFRLNINLSILVIDDNSPDRTYEIIQKLMAKFRNLYLIKRERKLGLGSAYIEGFEFALKNGYEAIVQMDADFSHNPNYLKNLVGLSDDFDLVIGSRYVNGGGISDWSWVRVWVSYLGNKFAKLFLRIPINDLTSGYKCIRKNVLESIKFRDIHSRGYSFQLEITYRAFLNGFKIKEFPIIFGGRKDDKSKMTFLIALEAFSKVIFLALCKIKSK